MAGFTKALFKFHRRDSEKHLRHASKTLELFNVYFQNVNYPFLDKASKENEYYAPLTNSLNLLRSFLDVFFMVFDLGVLTAKTLGGIFLFFFASEKFRQQYRQDWKNFGGALVDLFTNLMCGLVYFLVLPFHLIKCIIRTAVTKKAAANPEIFKALEAVAETNTVADPTYVEPTKPYTLVLRLFQDNKQVGETSVDSKQSGLTHRKIVKMATKAGLVPDVEALKDATYQAKATTHHIFFQPDQHEPSQNAGESTQLRKLRPNAETVALSYPDFGTEIYHCTVNVDLHLARS